MKFILISSFLMVSHAFAAVGGTEVGNGGDRFPEHYDTGWFLGAERTIRACISRAPDFPVSEEQIGAAIQSSFSKWVAYIHQKGVYETGFLFEAEEEDPTSATLRFAEKLQLESNCRRADLTFYFGQSTRKTERHRHKYVSPVSFIVRENYDVTQGWGKGFVWVQKDGLAGYDWHTPGLLDTVLLHEIGHIFGIGHIPDTVMSENLMNETALRLSEESGLWRYRRETLNTIDTVRQLYACLNCDVRFVGFEKQVCDLRFHDRFNWAFQLECRDQHGEYLWSIVPTADHRPISSGVEIFKRTQRKNGSLVSEAVEALNGQINYGKLTMRDGSVHTVVLERNININSLDLVILLMRDGEVQTLFHSEHAASLPAHRPCESAISGASAAKAIP